ncbi:hypothetical protein [uncultured Chitinophaga sp.]|uniref:hypothetical protein n=1 Tax=uncultured Chitinophaga sp. TaxID=339340 RepID=UPI0025F2737A|nr:hypothetical protein [uncultured Chitinophaga sp.]
MHQIGIINPKTAASLAEKLQCGDTKITHVDGEDMMMSFAETVLEGFELPPGFPDCCNFHTGLVTGMEEFWKRFPNCCENHIRLSEMAGFSKDQYAGIVQKTITTYMQTEYLVLKKINSKEWFEDISDFIEYADFSFGHMPRRVGGPLAVGTYHQQLTGLFNHHSEIPDKKRTKLLSIIEPLANDKKKKPPPDPLRLIATYEKWLGIFPFSMSYFSHLQPYFANRLPILEKEITVNRYSGMARGKIISTKKLIEYLLDTTNMLLVEINAAVFQKKGLLTDPEEKRMEVIIHDRERELKQLRRDFTDERAGYDRMLKTWFEGERHFLELLIAALQQAPVTQVKEVPAPKPFEVNVFCEKMPIDNATKHFKLLTERKSSNGKPFLTSDQLDVFIARAFGGQKGLPVQSINFRRGETQLIIYLFYQFYESSVRQWESNGQCRHKYIALLTDHFENWGERQVRTNFNKRPTTPL